MEVLVFGYSFTIGGIENYLKNINSILPKEIGFHFVVEKQKEKYKAEAFNDLSYTLIPNARVDLKEYISSIKEILREKRDKAKTVYVNVSDFKIENYVIIRLANKYGYKVVTHAHAAKGNEINGIIHKLAHDYICYRSRIITNKENNIRLAVSNRTGIYLYGRSRFEIVSPGIDVERYKYNSKKREWIRKELNLSSEFVVGFVGRLVEIKNPVFAIKVFQRILKRDGYNDSKMLVVGDGSLRGSLEQVIFENKLEDSIILSGQITNVEDYLSVMDCVVGTSLSEGLPLNILEALTSGLYCVCAENNYPEELKRFERFATRKLGDDYLEEWADLIISMNNYNYSREEGYKAVISEGYDQGTICNRLINLLN